MAEFIYDWLPILVASLPLLGFFGCHCCGDPCAIGSDTFDDDLAQWTVTGGESVSGGLLEMTGGDTAIFIPTPSSADLGVRIVTHPRTEDSTATMRLIVARTDANNYLFGQLSLASGVGEIRLGQVSGGSETWLTDAETLEDVNEELNERSDLTLCWQPGEVIEGVALTREGYAGEGVGVGWTDPEGVTNPSGVFAETSASPSTNTDVLGARDYGFFIPAGSTIDGIFVSARIEHEGMDVDYIDQIVRLTDRDGIPVGDNLAVGVSLNNVESVVTWGGPTEDWNAGLTWEDINSDGFGWTGIFRNIGSSGGNIRVRGVAIKVYFTTPDRTPGRLQLNYTNTASPNTVQCLMATPVLLDPGSQTGIADVVGSWDFTQYTLEYPQSDAKPTCGECQNCTVHCPCCDFESPEDYVVDFGTGGTIEGERVLTFLLYYPGPWPYPHCVWLFADPEAGEYITYHEHGDECYGSLEVTGGGGIYAGRYNTAPLGEEDCIETKTATITTPLAGFASSYDVEPVL